MNFLTPKLIGVLGLKFIKLFKASVFANVDSASPGCIFSNLIIAFFFRIFSIAFIYFIKSIGCEVFQFSPKDHDEAVSLISHLPIFLATALIETANNGNNQSFLNVTQKLAATGFADTSRVGGGNVQLGLDLAMNNKINILNAIDIFKNNLDKLESLIIENNWELLSNKLSEAKKMRENFID